MLKRKIVDTIREESLEVAMRVCEVTNARQVIVGGGVGTGVYGGISVVYDCEGLLTIKKVE